MSRIPAEDPPPALQLLTGKSKSGEGFNRTEDVEIQIRSALILPDNEIITNAKITDPKSKYYLQEETLVFLIKQSHKERNFFLYDTLFEILLGRCNKIINYYLRGLNADTREDATNEVGMKLIESIMRDDGKGDYLQVRFWNALKRMVIDVYRKYKKINHDDRRFLENDAFQKRDPDQSVEIDERVAQNQLNINGPRYTSTENEVLLREALQSLNTKMRLVYYLYHFEQWQIDSKSENHQVLSKHFGVTGRTIQNWLDEAQTELDKWRGDHDEEAN